MSVEEVILLRIIWKQLFYEKYASSYVYGDNRVRIMYVLKSKGKIWIFVSFLMPDFSIIFII